jgi:hypothetical protein
VFVNQRIADQYPGHSFIALCKAKQKNYNMFDLA